MALLPPQINLLSIQPVILKHYSQLYLVYLTRGAQRHLVDKLHRIRYHLLFEFAGKKVAKRVGPILITRGSTENFEPSVFFFKLFHAPDH